VHAKYPGKPILITENGTWSQAGHHGPSTTETTEEWQAARFTDRWTQVAERSDFVADCTDNGLSLMGMLTFAEERPKLVHEVFRKAARGG